MPMSGKEMLVLYKKQSWKLLREKGSHMIVGKDSDRETIPDHKELAKGIESKLLKHLKTGGNK